MTPAVRAARAAGIDFEVHRYRAAAHATGFGDEAARALGVDARQVFKTLVVRLDGAALVVALVPVAMSLDMKRRARCAGVKRAQLASTRQAQRSTGYAVGGISPLGRRKRLPTFVDETALAFSRIDISAGRRGLELALRPADLPTLCRGVAAELAVWNRLPERRRTSRPQWRRCYDPLARHCRCSRRETDVLPHIHLRDPARRRR